MALDLSAVKKRLDKLQTSASTSSLRWRPELDSETYVRLVPYKHSPNYPFSELYFYYNFGRTMLSPQSFGEPDPVVEFANKLKRSGEKDDWLFARKIEPKLRTYVPIIVRGEESEGIKFWGFGKTVYEALLNLMADDDYGDITDPQSGRDIKIIYKSKETTGKSFPETDIMPRGKESVLVEDAKLMKKILEDQPELKEVFEREWVEPDALKSEFEAWVRSGAKDEDDDDDDSTSVTAEIAATSSDLSENVVSKIDKLFEDD